MSLKDVIIGKNVVKKFITNLTINAILLQPLMNHNIDGYVDQWLKLNHENVFIKNSETFFQLSVHVNENSSQEIFESEEENKPSIFIHDEDNSLQIVDKDGWIKDTFKELKKKELSKSTHVINETGHDNDAFNSTKEDKAHKLSETFDGSRKDSLNNQIKCNTTFGICEELTNYPSDLVKKELDANPAFRYLEVNETREEYPVVVANRFGEPDIQLLCHSKTQYLRPKAARNEFNEVSLVANSDNFVQLIEVEICDDNKSSCDFSENFPAGYTSVCQQKYIHRKLLAMDSSKKLGPQIFKIPAGCCCGVKFQGDF